MSVDLLRGLYDYHRWANRRLFDVAVTLGADVTREVGTQFSFPTLKGMFAHVHGADRIWLDRWKGKPAGRLLGDADFRVMEDLRAAWDTLEEEQRVFVDSLSVADLARPVSYTSGLFGGKRFEVPLGPLMQHVANHGTHHRSEIATMITMMKGSPPGTDLVIYQLVSTGQISETAAGWR
jgi:uncharacterized damage-inducible protein DinB